jgi:hypothetical protein
MCDTDPAVVLADYIVNSTHAQTLTGIKATRGKKRLKDSFCSFLRHPFTIICKSDKNAIFIYTSIDSNLATGGHSLD